MKKISKQFIVITSFILLALSINAQIAFAIDDSAPLKYLKTVGDNTGLPSFKDTGQHPDAPSDYIQEGVGTLTSPIYFAIDFFRYLISGIAFVVIIISAIKLISTSTEEEATKVKNHLVYGVIGLLVIQLADVAVKKIFFGEQGEAFEDIATTQLYAEEGIATIRGLIGFANFFLGAVAILVIIIRGFTLLTSGGDEEALNKAKQHIVYAIAGLVVIGLSEVVVRGFIFPKQGEALPDVEVGKRIIISVTNYIASFIAIFAFAILFYSGYRYVVSGGSEEVTEKVKKGVLGAVIGLVLALGAFALVQTFVTLDDTTGEIPSPPGPQTGVPQAQPILPNN